MFTVTRTQNNQTQKFAERFPDATAAMIAIYADAEKFNAEPLWVNDMKAHWGRCGVILITWKINEVTP